MTRVLFVGQKPNTVDFSDPSLPPGFSAEKIQAGIDIAETIMTERGWDANICMIAPDDSGIATLAAQLGSVVYDCVVIGGGLRIPPKGLPFFEQAVNAIHQSAPKAAIAFNTLPRRYGGGRSAMDRRGLTARSHRRSGKACRMPSNSPSVTYSGAERFATPIGDLRHQPRIDASPSNSTTSQI